MPIEFKPVRKQEPQKPTAPRKPPVMLWIPPATEIETQERLFHFLLSLRDGHPRVDRPVLTEQQTLHTLYRNPCSDLRQAYHHCLDNFLVQLGPDGATWGELSVSPNVWGMALVIYNCLTPSLVQGDDAIDPVSQFCMALVNTIPPARSRADILGYHALLQSTAEFLPNLPPNRTPIMQALVNRSPLSAAYHLHIFTPPVLLPLAAELLRGWERCVSSIAPWHNPDDWLNTLMSIFDYPAIEVYLRRRWLTLPETRPVCRNLGLLLEMLRRRGHAREFILRFYEAYDHFCAERMDDPWYGKVRRWKLLLRIERLLHAEGNTQAAIRLNRWGNEYFLKFYALIQMIIAEDGMPTDYNHLTRDLVLALRPLLQWTSMGGTIQRLHLGTIEFGDEAKQ